MTLVGNKWELFEKTEQKPSVRIRGVPNGTRIVVVSDQQVPLEDRRLLKAIFEDFVPRFKPKSPAEYHVFINGDGLDLFSLSGFLSRVLTNFDVGDEVDIMKWYLKRWGKHFTHKHYVFGNHEDRWERYIFENAAQMAPFTETLAEALSLDTLGYDWVPYLKHYDFQGFIITHGDTTIQNTAKKMMEMYQSSGTSGHVNRPQSWTWADASNGESATWYCTGMTCRMDIGEVIKVWRKIQPWQQGFLIGEVQDGILHTQLVRVHHGKFSAAGRIVTIPEKGYEPEWR